MKYLFLLALILTIVTSYSFDGSGNNIKYVSKGKAGNFFSRLPFDGQFNDSVSVPVQRLNPRHVSDLFGGATQYDFTVNPPKEILPKNTQGRNMLSVFFNQFINHDIEKFRRDDFGGGTRFDLSMFDPQRREDGNDFVRIIDSILEYSEETGQVESRNDVTSWLDLSHVYGSDEATARALRTFQDGKLITRSYIQQLGPIQIVFDNLPPSANDTGILPNFRIQDLNKEFSAGDNRITENIGLTLIQVVFLREHNRLAQLFAIQHPDWNDEKLYQEARKFNIAQYQHIVFDEHLPSIIKGRNIPEYDGYDKRALVDTPVHFAFQAFRADHSSVTNWKLRKSDGCPLTYTVPAGVFGPFPFESDELFGSGALGGPLDPIFTFITAATTSPAYPGGPMIPNNDGPDNIITGLLQGPADEVDRFVSDTLRNIPFVVEGRVVDIYAADIYRARLQGAPDYNSLRSYYHQDSPGNSRKGDLYRYKECVKQAEVDSLECFKLITSNEQIAQYLKNIYGKVNNIDGIVGLLSEYKESNVVYSPTTEGIILDHLLVIRRGDRLWYENILDDTKMAEIKSIKFADLLKRYFNGPIQDNVFEVVNTCNN